VGELTTPDPAPYDESTATAAIRRYEDRLAKDPASLAFAPLADLYRKTGRIAEAVALCRKGLRHVPHYMTARLVLAKTLLAAGDLDAALAELNAIRAASPLDVQCHRLLAEVQRRRGDIDASVQHLETAVKLDPSDRDSRAALRLLRVAPASGSEGGVARVLRDDTFATVTFGTICLEQGLIEEAADVFRRLVKKDPTDHRARDGLDRALRAKSGRKRG